MDLSYTAEEQAFRDDVRGWLAKRLSKRLSDKVRKAQRLTKADYQEWHALLIERGWMAWHWPVEHGGTGWTPVQKHIFEEEMVAAGAPRIIPFGLNMLGPVLIRYGTEKQKAFYLPRILNDEDWWAQGYSEPGAGSDLASLKTSAVRDGDHYVVNGQKTWTTLAHFANRIFCLVRTDPDAPKRQQGISFLLIGMFFNDTATTEIYTLEGEHEVNEVFLTDVRVPVENLVGEENDGWTVAKYLLNYERTGIAGVGFSKQSLGALKKIAAQEICNGRPLADNPHFAARMARLEIDLMAMEIFNLRVVAAAGEGKLPGAESSLLKIKGTQVRQEATDLLRRAVGPYAAPDLPEAFDEGWNGEAPGPDYALPLARAYFNMRKTSIYGGSNEIQRNIVAKHLLGF
jgi:alkylation response protein AidB-like acyl-CoA dehydrogenase